MKKYRVILLLIFVCIMSQACSSKNESTAPQSAYNSVVAEAKVYENSYEVADIAVQKELYGLDNGASYGEFTGAAATSAPETGSGSATATEQNDKIIKTCNISLESGSYELTVNSIRNIVDSCKGYIENSSSYSRAYAGRELRYFNATLKIPAQQYEPVKRSLETLGRVKSVDENASNVSAQYYDIESRLKSKLIEEERLLELISKATTIKDLLTLEERLTQIRTTIEQYQSSLSRIDKQVAYSTISISLSETADEQITDLSDNLSDRIKASFIKSVNVTVRFLQEIIIFLAGIFIPVIIVAILVIVGVTVYNRKKKKGENENEEKH